jgi:hypothetical protein
VHVPCRATALGSPDGPELSRRRLLAGLGAGAGVLLLGACGDDGGSGVESGGTDSGSDVPGDAEGDGIGGPTYALSQFFGGPLLAAGTESRAPFGVSDRDGLLPADATPDVLEVQLHDATDAPVGAPIEVRRHDDGLPRGYFPLRFTVEAPGIYVARTEVDREVAEMSVQVHAEADLRVIRPGQPLPPLQTPTTTDARGVDPICTRSPACDLHDLTVADALEEERPLALLVATPAYCQVAICGPVLDVLLDVMGEHPEVRYLHAEVFAHPEDDASVYAPVIDDLGLHFEPVLVLVGADGVVRERVDVIYDRVELRDALARLTEAA